MDIFTNESFIIKENPIYIYIYIPPLKGYLIKLNTYFLLT